MEGSKCLIDSKVYQAGAEVCDEKRCYVCRDGNWEEKSTLDFFMGGP
ncbi:MAG: hypothetical protein WAW37_05755 [Syntrophobacteraceae bacterium]